MSIVVVAILSAKSGRGSAVLDSFSRVSPLVHAEEGCELYAAHLERGGDRVVMIERWSSQAALDGHAEGEPLALLNALNADLLERPYDVWFLDAVPLGEPSQGRI